MHSKNRYLFPIDKTHILHVRHDSPAHILNKDETSGEVYDARHAIDFLCHEGTPILAAKEGIVVHVVNYFKKIGIKKKCLQKSL